MLRVLIIYSLEKKRVRKTIDDHLYSFKRYSNDIRFVYLNARFGIPKWITWINFDAVILHYTFLALRWPNSQKVFFSAIDSLKSIRSLFVAIPQDEYDFTHILRNCFSQLQVVSVFTLAETKDQQKLYPKTKVPSIKYFFSVLPGYVDENTLKIIRHKHLLKPSRPIDIGYRARHRPYWYGRPLFEKWHIGQKIKTYCQKNTCLKLDISIDSQNAFYGLDWIKFLSRCNAVLGVEGGTNILEPRKNKRCTELYLKKHPQATFDQVEAACFPQPTLYYLKTTPRHFEAAMTKTCQILLEGKYRGILKPGIHYIELKKDYSNLPEVIAQFQNKKLRQQIISNAYKDLVLSGKYTYRKFVKLVIDHLKSLSKHPKHHPSQLNQIKFALVLILSQLQAIYVLTYCQLLNLIFVTKQTLIEIKKKL